ncbi:hypothetical protein [Trichocoleus sp. DQ-U1]
MLLQNPLHEAIALQPHKLKIAGSIEAIALRIGSDRASSPKPR